MSSRSLRILLTLVVAGVVCLPVVAGEGRIPIYQDPTVITAPGKYIVTRNINSVAGGPIIDIQVSGVDIDLNGMVLMGGPAPVIHSLGNDNITIRNGTCMTGQEGIRIVGNETGNRKVVIEDVKVIDPEMVGIILEGITDFAIRRTNVIGAGREGIRVDAMIIMPDGGPAQGTLEDNQVENCHTGIYVLNGSSVGVINNRIERMTAGQGIVMEPCAACLISNNTIRRTGTSGIHLMDSSGCKLYNNLVREAGTDDATGPVGIWLQGFSDDNLLLHNVVTQSFTDGVFVEGFRNHIEKNVMNRNGVGGSGHGLHLSSAIGGDDNTYGRNTARGNPGGPCGGPATPDFCDEGVNNGSFNDNYMPGWM